MRSGGLFAVYLLETPECYLKAWPLKLVVIDWPSHWSIMRIYWAGYSWFRQCTDFRQMEVEPEDNRPSTRRREHLIASLAGISRPINNPALALNLIRYSKRVSLPQNPTPTQGPALRRTTSQRDTTIMGRGPSVKAFSSPLLQL